MGCFYISVSVRAGAEEKERTKVATSWMYNLFSI